MDDDRMSVDRVSRVRVSGVRIGRQWRGVLRWSLLLLLLIPAVGARAQAVEPTLAAVQINGLRNVPEARVRGVIIQKPGERFDAARMEADRKAVLALGYFRSVLAAQQNQNGRVTVTYRVVELPRVIHIRVFGNTVVDQKSIYERISTERGRVLRLPQLRKDIEAIEGLYQEHGYVAHISDSFLDDAADSGIVRFRILEVRIDSVEIEGGTPDARERVRRELQQTASLLYRPEAVAADRKRVLRVRGVRDALPDVTAVAPGKVRIRWRLTGEDRAHDRQDRRVQ